MKVVFLSTLLLLICSFNSAAAWDNDDLEIFDLVELINLNFYKFMGIQQVCYVDVKIFNFSSLSRHFRKPLYRKSSERSEHFQFNFTLTRIPLQTRMCSFVIWSAYMKFWRIQERGRSTIMCWRTACPTGNRRFTITARPERLDFLKARCWFSSSPQSVNIWYRGQFILRRSTRW